MDSIKYYTDINDLGIFRFQKYNKLYAKACEIGSDMSSFHQRLRTVANLVYKDMKEEAGVELENLQLCYDSMNQESTTAAYALACLVKEIDGVKRGYDDDSLQETVKILDQKGMKISDLFSTLDDVKKK